MLSRHALCKWHVHQAWQRRLRSDIPDISLRNTVYNILMLMMEEQNEESFLRMKESFILDYRSKCNSFVDYLIKNYENRAHFWALCYRNFPHGHTDTNMYFESLHNRIKTYYMERKQNRRIDNLVDLLFEMERDTFSIFTELERDVYREIFLLPSRNVI